MKKLFAVLPVIFALTFAACGSDEPALPKLDGSFTGLGCTISFPKTYKVDSVPDGIIIGGNFNMGIKIVKNASIKAGSAPILLLNIKKQDEKAKKTLTHLLTKISGFDAVQAEGFDQMKRYSYTIYVPVDGGIFILYQEPAFLNDPLMKLSHTMANTWKIVDPQYFVGR